MRSGVERRGPLNGKTRVRRPNRKLNGMAETAGVADPPVRGRLTRTLALVKAALRVWETNHPPRAKVSREPR
jgi:hypothetical protein